MEEFYKILKFWKVLALLVCFFVISLANPQWDKIQAVSKALLQNQTAFGNVKEVNQFMNRAGEFASRALWVKKGKFVFPKGTLLSFSPKITVPAFRKPAWEGGLNSDIQASWFLYMNLDKMGWTDPMHPFPFDRPPFYPFGHILRGIGEAEAEEKKTTAKPELKRPMMAMGPPHAPQYYYPDHYLRRRGRSIMSLPPPENHHGGERAVILPRIESIMGNLGFEGRGCMLRAICEIHEFPLQQGYGLFGEMIELFFSVSRSPYAESHMPEYLKAEDAGRAGNCLKYKKLCAKSVFKWEVEKKQNKEDVDANQILPASLRSKLVDDEL